MSLGEDGFVIVDSGIKEEAEALRLIAIDLYRRLDDNEPDVDELVGPFRAWGGVEFAKALKHATGLEEAATAVDAKFPSLAGGHWEHMRNITFFRRIAKGQQGVTWHIDAEAASTTRYHHDCATLWFPLEQVGGDRPSLELVRGSHKLMRRRGDIKRPQHRSDEFVSTIPGERVAPSLDIGGAIVFDHYTLHRTQQIQAKVTRLSAEFRFKRKS